jgi:hypothetical protein
MGMMRTIAILRQEVMAPEGLRRYGVSTGKKAIVWVAHQSKAREIAKTLNEIKPLGTCFYRPCVGPDHYTAYLRKYAPPLLQ